MFLKNPADTKVLSRVRALIDEVASDPVNGVDRVLSNEDLRALGADPRASFAISMRSGFYAGPGFAGLNVQAGAQGGHGHDPALPAMHASLIMAGPQVPHAGNLGVVKMTQIAPTIAAWFHEALSPEAGQPLRGVLRPHQLTATAER